LDFYRQLGPQGPLVSRLCFGTLTAGPLQANLTPAAGGALFALGYGLGVTFYDTAEIYGTYPHLRSMLTIIQRLERDGRPPPVIATKAYVHTAAAARRSLERALDEIGRPFVDIFLLHELDSPHALDGHREALDFLWEARARGRVRWVGISTHSPVVVHAAALEPRVAIIHAPVNPDGLGLTEGDAGAMAAAVALARDCGKGFYAMKVLGGGNLGARAAEAISYAAAMPGVDALAIGMQSEAEIRFNVSLLRGERPDAEVVSALVTQPRRLHVEQWCTGCGTCVPYCRYGALAVRTAPGTAPAASAAPAAGHAAVDQSLCVLCGYCAARCPAFAIRVL
jgi:aryl-alcohol dehydrogenase-like predicted oxidoreductase